MVASRQRWRQFCHYRRMVLMLALSVGACGTQARGQMVNVSTPFTVSSDRFFENFGVGFGFGFPAASGFGSRVVGLGPNGQLYPNVRFQQNLSAIPPFGGYNPAAGAQLGFQRIGSNGGGFGLSLFAAQGSQRTNVSAAPSLTVMNGGSGYFFNGSTRPFVNGYIPIVGNQYVSPVPVVDNGVTRAVASGQLNLSSGRSDAAEFQPTRPLTYSDPNSSAMQSAASVTEIKSRREAQLKSLQRRINAKLEVGDKLVAEGKPVDARIEYRSVLGLTDDESVARLVKQKIKATRERLPD